MGSRLLIDQRWTRRPLVRQGEEGGSSEIAARDSVVDRPASAGARRRAFAHRAFRLSDAGLGVAAGPEALRRHDLAAVVERAGQCDAGAAHLHREMRLLPWARRARQRPRGAVDDPAPAGFHRRPLQVQDDARGRPAGRRRPHRRRDQRAACQRHALFPWDFDRTGNPRSRRRREGLPRSVRRRRASADRAAAAHGHERRKRRPRRKPLQSQLRRLPRRRLARQPGAKKIRKAIRSSAAISPHRGRFAAATRRKRSSRG